MLEDDGEVYTDNRYWNSYSYGMLSMLLGSFPMVWLLYKSTIDFLNDPDVGNWFATHLTNESASCAKSSMFRNSSSGTAILFVLATTIEACRYSSFDLSNSATTPSAVYIFTCTFTLDFQHWKGWKKNWIWFFNLRLEKNGFHNTEQMWH